MATSIGTSTWGDGEVARSSMSLRREQSRTSSSSGSSTDAERLTRALGWFSIGLGLAQIVAPRGVARLVGAEPSEGTARLMRGLGLREISSGVGILSNTRSEAWVRSRVAGDVMDLALLGTALVANDADRGKTIAATVAVLGVTALDILASEKMAQRNDGGLSHTRDRDQSDSDEKRYVRRAITIRKSPDEVAAFWRDKGDDEAANDETVRFVVAPGNRGTEVHLERSYKSPGRIASVIATLRHEDPAQHAFDELFALKQILETGDTVVSDAWQNGPHAPHPAQPD
jgi:hypothetical protein